MLQANLRHRLPGIRGAQQINRRGRARRNLTRQPRAIAQHQRAASRARLALQMLQQNARAERIIDSRTPQPS